ncbi:hypothetical protein NAT47_09765 [Flavobacterium sp. HXWNR69]|uniref:Outer membrane protein beta-barrel domain-containing protein n=1 Tax=Flavobacterium fragile TaxID=2949085 RepID=A0ABT0TIA8_9FLAO|nr:hypothetical protein [Flavobacterium sp. HXWNR69]MCL9770705.1 hypothetical protein [Flavobacterium sp. HXWNR69]
MKKTILLVLLTLGTFSYAQEQEVSKKWLFGFGSNLLNNNALHADKYFSSKDINVIPTVSAFTVQRKFDNKFSVEGQFFLNELEKENLHNGMMIDRNVTYASINVNGLYTFDSHLVDVKWFDASVIAGLGAMWTDGVPNQTFNTGLALDFWLSPLVGLRLETQGRFAFEKEQLGNNHIIHAASIILPIQ